ncbi:hypothetical protein PISMIDRAFT_652325, partial [Pisolithus microcarpus 441]
HPLAYVEWFTTLQWRDPVSGLYIVTCSTRNRRRNATIISIDRIVHACHLQVRCGVNSDEGVVRGEARESPFGMVGSVRPKGTGVAW